MKARQVRYRSKSWESDGTGTGERGEEDRSETGETVERLERYR